MRCKKCGRKLIDKESMQRGYGPVCWEEHTGSIKKQDYDIDGQMSMEDILFNQNNTEIERNKHEKL